MSRQAIFLGQNLFQLPAELFAIALIQPHPKDGELNVFASPSAV